MNNSEFKVTDTYTGRNNGWVDSLNQKCEQCLYVGHYTRTVYEYDRNNKICIGKEDYESWMTTAFRVTGFASLIWLKGTYAGVVAFGACALLYGISNALSRPAYQNQVEGANVTDSCNDNGTSLKLVNEGFIKALKEKGITKTNYKDKIHIHCAMKNSGNDFTMKPKNFSLICVLSKEEDVKKDWNFNSVFKYSKVYNNNVKRIVPMCLFSNTDIDNLQYDNKISTAFCQFLLNSDASSSS